MNAVTKFFKWYFSRNALPYWAILAFDSLVVLCSGLVCYALDHGSNHTLSVFWSLLGTMCFYLLFYIIGFRVTRTYTGVLRFSSFSDIYRVGIANFIGLSCVVVCRVLCHADKVFLPIRIKEIIFTTILATIIMAAARIVIKYMYESVLDTATHKKAFIYGVHTGGIALAKGLRVATTLRFSLKGFISDADDMIGHTLQGVNVYKNDDQLISTMQKMHVTALLVSPLKRDRLIENQDMVNALLNAGISIYFSDLNQKWDGKSDLNASSLHEVEIEDLLPREEIQVDLHAVEELLKGKKILITGSAGSIGSEMVRQIAKFSPSNMVLIDEAETPQHDIRLMMAHDYPEVEAETIVTSITNQSRMEKIFSSFKPDYVFHAAAYKHVPMMEDNPSEAVFNNIYGTRVIADLAVKYGVKKFVMISTDKAVNPTNVMGCSKRICEIYCQSLNKAVVEGKVKGQTQFVTTRFGNVLGSNGSVIPLFREQIKNGGPVTVTHPDIIRFFMLIPEACTLVLEAGTMGKGGEIFIFDMGKPVKIADLAHRMILLSGAKNVEVQFTGLRDGEKLYEEVLNDEEITKPTFNKKIKIAQVREYDYDEACKDIEALIEQSHLYDDMKTVRLMKQIVPEYKSQHSKYETLDEKK